MRQKFSESAEQFIDIFKREKNRCRMYMPEVEIVRMTQNGLEFELRKKFEGMEFRDLFELSSRATRHESLLREVRHRNTNSYGTYFQEVDVETKVNVDVA